MIKIKNISKSFSPKKEILKDISLNINKGDIVAIIGQSGVGKSVLLKHINGLLIPDKGSVYIDDFCINTLTFSELQKIRKKISMVFQFGALFDSMNIYDNIKIALDNATKLKNKDKAKVIKESLAAVGLPDIELMYPADISGGMKKRVGIARAISISPQYILYDEPTTGLDPINTDKMILLMKKIQKREKSTSVIVTHEMRIINELATKIIMLKEGKIIFDGTPNELNSSSDKYIKYFISGQK
ncbi:MAG: ABC transporter ATP-binding protein [Candidatus Marinimicrobia bacterium]|nr:ABC transporter ATP-binding protein [Candidatus Neomarinimicrobiota bacterium]|tara:strand:- start:354 stop:1082 length:729 start_codon:yes stop_codon:yes gene_type:complete